MKTIGILIERQRTYGRRLCQGIVKYARAHTDWILKIIESADLENPANIAGCDAFIARVMSDGVARRLKATRKPVVDVFCEKDRPGFASADQDAILIGEMAARHFIEHRFSRFAFCGYNGISYSDLRRDAFANFLGQYHYQCAVYDTPRSVLRQLELTRTKGEQLDHASDHRQLGNWLNRLEKPVAVFCANDMRAYQVIGACRALGIDVPREIAVLGVDDELVCEFMQPTLSSIDPNGRGVGYAASELLDKMFASKRTMPKPARVGPLRLVSRESTNTFPLNPPWLSDALVFIGSNIAKNITAADVYRHIGKSHTLIDTAFRSVLHTSVQKEIIRLKAMEAKRLVCNTGMPFGEVAHRSGFASAQYFCAAFQKTFGISPTAMRQDAQKHS